MPSDDYDADKAVATDGNSGADLGDKVYRKVAAQYERESGREPTIGDPYQTGWDITSFDPETKETRLIEVKGKGCPWTKDEVVELSRAQVRKAFKGIGRADTGFLVSLRCGEDGMTGATKCCPSQIRPK